MRPRSNSGGTDRLLTRRWLSDATSRATALLICAAFASYTVVVIVVSAFTPTAAQDANARLGSSQQSSHFSVEVGDLDTDLEDVNARGDLGSAYLYFDSTQLRPDALTKTFVQAAIPNVRFLQGARLQEFFPGRYEVDEGDWPATPGEVLISDSLADKLGGASEFSVLSGRVDFRVVGRVTDTYDRHGDVIVAAPGTWERISPLPAAKSYQPVTAEIYALFEPPTTIKQLRQRLHEVLPKRTRDQLRLISGNVTTRGELLAEPVDPFGSDQFVVSYGPLFLVVVLIAAMAAGRARPAHRRVRAQLYAIGVRRGVLRAQLITEVLVGGVAAAGGLGVGWLTAMGLHRWVLPTFANQTLSPVVSPGVDAGLLAAGAIGILVVGIAWPGAGDDSVTGVESTSTQGQARLLRWAAAVLLLIGATWVGASIASRAAAYFAVAACSLFAPDVLRLAVRLLPQRRPRTLTARALMRATELRQATGVVAIACCVALPVLSATQIASAMSSNASFDFGRIPADQVWIQNDSTGTGDIAGVARAVSAVVGLAPPVAISGSGGPDPEDPKAYLTRTYKGPGFTSRALMIVETASDAERVLGPYLDREGVYVLNSGGVLVLSGAEGQQRLRVESATGEVLLRTPLLPTLSLHVSRQLRALFGGVLLLDTAKGLGIPVGPASRFIFTDIDSDDIASAVQSAVDAGYDSEFVQYAVPPPEPALPIYAYSFAAALLFTGFFLVLAVLRDSARRMRDRGSMLLALGLTPSWITSVAMLQVALLVVVGFAVGIGAGLLGIAVTSSAYAVTTIPISAVIVASVGTALVVVSATALALRGLTTDEQVT